MTKLEHFNFMLNIALNKIPDSKPGSSEEKALIKCINEYYNEIKKLENKRE